MSPLGVLFTALGYATGIAVFWIAGRKAGWTPRQLAWLLVAALAGGVFGAKLTQWLVLGWPFSAPLAAIGDPLQGGKTILGGIVCGWIAVEAMKMLLRVRRSTGDLFAIALPAGEAVGRFGCLFNACCYGAESLVPWAVWQHGAWRHPAQLYASLAALAVLVVLFGLRGRLWREGDLFRAYLVLYGAGRFGVEFFRVHDRLYAGLSLAQWVSLELALAGAVALWLSAWAATRAQSKRGV